MAQSISDKLATDAFVYGYSDLPPVAIPTIRQEVRVQG